MPDGFPSLWISSNETISLRRILFCSEYLDRDLPTPRRCASEANSLGACCEQWPHNQLLGKGREVSAPVSSRRNQPGIAWVLSKSMTGATGCPCPVEPRVRSSSERAGPIW